MGRQVRFILAVGELEGGTVREVKGMVLLAPILPKLRVFLEHLLDVIAVNLWVGAPKQRAMATGVLEAADEKDAAHSPRFTAAFSPAVQGFKRSLYLIKEFTLFGI